MKKQKIAAIIIAVLVLSFAYVKEYKDDFDLKVSLPGSISLSIRSDGATNAADSSRIPLDISNMVDRVSPAVVNIETTTKVNSAAADPFFNDPFFREFFGDQFPSQSQEEKGIGTGFIITDTGYIVTNYHVVQGAGSISVKLVGFSEPLPARVIGSDDQLDLAVIKVTTSRKLPVVTLGNSDRTKVGEWVVAIGNPYGLDHTVTVGVVSAKERPVTIEGRKYANFIQTDAAINPGNSGGPLLNTAGEVVAINTAVNAQAQGIGFAIPINNAKEVLDQLMNKGKVSRPYLGVYLRDVTPELADYLGASSTNGALIAEIVAGTPAEAAGLKKGDIILYINSHKVVDGTDLTQDISKRKSGEKVTLKILRDKKEMTVTATLREKD